MEEGNGSKFGGTGIYSGFVALAVFAVVLVILAAQNTESVTLEFLGLNITTPLIALLLGSVLFGAVIDEVVGFVWRRRRRRLLAERAELEARRTMATDDAVPEETDSPAEEPAPLN